MCFADRSHKPKPIADKHNLVSANSPSKACRIPCYGLLAPNPSEEKELSPSACQKLQRKSRAGTCEVLKTDRSHRRQN